MDAEFTSSVARGGYYTSLGGIPNYQWLSPVFGVVSLFYGAVKGVHVDVYDFSHP
jgi:hypothetical protein